MISLLLIEDETDLGLIIADNLRSVEYEVLHCQNGEQGLMAFYQMKPQMVILDIMLPGLDGFTIAQKIRERDHETPILFLTARTQTVDVVNAFELGANDYLRKPFSLEELKVRINALLNRNLWQNEKRFLHIGNYIMDSMRQILQYNGKEITLSFRECELIKMLFENKNKVMSRQDIIQAVWPNDRFFTGRSLDVFISRIRTYLQEDKNISIVNIRGVGYKMIV